MNGIFALQTMTGPDVVRYRFASRRLPEDWCAHRVEVGSAGPAGVGVDTQSVSVWVAGDQSILSSGVPLVAVVGCADPVAGWVPEPLQEAAVGVARVGAMPLVTLPGESGILAVEALLSAGLPVAVVWDSLSPRAFDDASRALVRRVVEAGGVVVALSDPREQALGDASVVQRPAAVTRRAWRHVGAMADAGVGVDVPASALTAEALYTLCDRGRPVVGLSWGVVASGWADLVEGAATTREALERVLGPLN